MHGIITHVNVSPGGIPKRPIPEGRVQRLGIEGDAVAHPKYHGGPRQALLLIMEESLAEMRAMGYEVYPGALGENLTLRGLDRHQFRIGQRFRIAEGLIEITKPRMPCKTLNPYGTTIQKAIYDQQVKAGDASSPRWGLSGFYAAVVQPFTVRPGATISLADQAV